MFKRRPLATLAATTLCAASLHAVDLTNEEIDSLRDWINSKRMVTVKEMGGQLSISGDVHTEMQSSAQVINGESQDHGADRHGTGYDVEFNLNVDYRADRSWAAARVRFDNDAGVTNEWAGGSGKSDKIKCDRAYFGYRIFDGDRHTMDVEAGRRPMSSIWDSRVQFASNFDGVTFKDSYAFENAGDFYYRLGAFLVNDSRGQFGVMGEVGVLNIARTGFYGKYSLTDWNTKHHLMVIKSTKIPHVFQFVVSQLTLGYKFIPQKIDKLIHIYTAGLYNAVAKKNPVSDHTRANFGGYAGFAIGEQKQAGDWTLDANYQVVAAQCIPAFDVLGVGRGYSNTKSFYFTKDPADKDNAIATNVNNAMGNTNYRGFAISLQYLISNNLNIFQEYKQSITLDGDIGRDTFTRYNQYEIDFIYSF